MPSKPKSTVAATAKPAASPKAVVAKPMAAKPAAAKPAAAKPVAAKPVAAKAAPAKTPVAKPAETKTAAKRVAAKPSTAKPAAKAPEVAAASTAAPALTKKSAPAPKKLAAKSAASTPAVKSTPAKAAAPAKPAPVPAAPMPSTPKVAEIAPRVETKPVDLPKPVGLAKPLASSETAKPVKPVDVPPVKTAQASVAAVQLSASLPAGFVPGAALPKAMQEFATSGLNQAREAYEKVRSSAEALSNSVGTSGEAAARGIQAFSQTLIDALQANADSTLGFMKSMAGVRSVSEAVELQARHARTHFEAVTEQAKALAGIANRTMSETTAPVRKALEGKSGS